MLPSELIAHEKNWIKGDYAQDINGNHTLTTDPKTVRFCMQGALNHCGIMSEKINELRRKLGGSVIMFNDHEYTTHADVITVLKSVGL